MSTPTVLTENKRYGRVLVITALMLFSMFFGAGNLIFPPQLGLEAGDNFWPAIFGFLIAGVIIPVISVIAIAMSGTSVRDLARRGGWLFGLLFPIAAYLSIGAFYALPRTGAVAFETSITPLTGWDSTFASFAFNLVFFGIALGLSWNPNTIAATLGRVLTPLLVILLAVLIVVALVRYDAVAAAPSEDFANHPIATGLLNGYLTMDAIAGLAFGIVVISTLRHHGFSEERKIIRGTIGAGLVSAALLALVYVGLGLIGRILPEAAELESGSAILAFAANQTMGLGGQIIFSAIVLLACLTTAVGLISATSEFFHSLTPKLSYHLWAVVFTLMSLGLATAGLETVLTVAAPVITFIYPPAITLIMVAILHPLLNSGETDMFWTYRLAIWVAVIWSAITVLGSFPWGASLNGLVEWAPLQSASLGWVLPTTVAFLIGLTVDFVGQKKNSTPAPVAA